ncbi:MAG: RNA methyltransferase [Saprospiraceae bacterium]|nr:RNA methyltransferase [Saprospiraceae bacterium]
MLSRSQLKTIRALQTKKHRQKYQKFTVEGEKIVREALLECPDQIESIIAVSGQFERHQFPVSGSISWIETDEHSMALLSSLQTPPGIIAVVNNVSPTVISTGTDPWMIFLDGVRDPGNMGTILRTADWFGYTTVLLGPGCVDVQNPKVIQASMGSIFRINCLELTLEDVQTRWPNHPLFAADMLGTDATSVQWPDKGILVMGNESHGLTLKPTSVQWNRVCIHKNPGSRAESLNVAMAAGILMQLITDRKSARKL